MANHALKQSPALKEKINEALSQAGKEFLGGKRVTHYLQVLVEDIGIEKLKQKVSNPLSNLKVAPFYGCHALRPSGHVELDDPERPSIFENLIKALGAECVEYRNKLKCCGGLLRGFSDEIALDLAREKLVNTSKAGADCIATLCPFCFVALDIGQMQVRSKFNETYDMPVLHYTELLALALGIDPKELALETHKIKVDKVLNKIS
jgi:heterodisulfide reductase subunit B